MFVFGGYSDNTPCFGDLVAYDVEQHVWLKFPIFPGQPSKRYNFGMIVHKGKIYFIGGIKENMPEYEEELWRMYTLDAQHVLKYATLL